MTVGAIRIRPLTFVEVDCRRLMWRASVHQNSTCHFFPAEAFTEEILPV
jgi:hypothetical protein